MEQNLLLVVLTILFLIITDAGRVAEFVPERKLNAVRKDSPALNLVEDQKDHQTEPGGELDQEPDQPVMEVERNNNTDNIGSRDSDLTDCEDLEVTSLQCYQCLINPLPGHFYNTTKRLCVHFDYSDKFIVDCPYSTMCMKQDFYLDIQNGVRIKGELRDCASQKHEYQDYKNGRWSPKMEVLEPYNEGCENLDDKGERATRNRYCYCRTDLCNSSPSTNHEGYTDIMGVIVVFNLMKYINSLR